MSDQSLLAGSLWRTALPVLVGRHVTLREPDVRDTGAILDLVSLPDSTSFCIDAALSEETVRQFIERAVQDRAAGRGFTYAITSTVQRTVTGLLQVRQLDPAFEAAEWECTLAPESRGTGAFLEAARLAGSLAFAAIGARRLEARVVLQNGRANGALRKLGAVQEGILRRSIRRRDDYFDQVLWSVLKEDWGEHWAQTTGRVH